jgi:hypothetical protein
MELTEDQRLELVADLQRAKRSLEAIQARVDNGETLGMESAMLITGFGAKIAAAHLLLVPQPENTADG